MKNLLILGSILFISGTSAQASNNPFDNLPNYNSSHQQSATRYASNRHQERHNFLTIQIERTAKSHLGKTYEWGATGPYTFDCSGFTQAVYAQYGITIPRVSRDQAKVGKFIRWEDLKKGDLIFFDSKKSSQVSHVGIYLGGGKFIHASSSKHQVVISNLNSNYYSSHFKLGRRFV